MKRSLLSIALLLVSVGAFADISVTERSTTMRLIDTAVSAKMSGQQTPAGRAALRAANQAKRDAKHRRQHPTSQAIGAHVRTNATGSVQLIDASGLKYFINTNITFSTSSSASGAASEASYTHAVAASTLNGGVTMSSPSDMYDGYNAICVSLTNAAGPCQTGNANYTMYNQNGPASVDTTVPAIAACTGRQYVLPAKAIGGLSVRRKIFVPNNDTYIRWFNTFTNTTGAPITFTMITSTNLGSDSNTTITATSSGDLTATTADLWVASFQNYSGTTSTDVRMAAVIQGAGAPTPVANINFVNGDDNPHWAYSITLAPGQTKAILNFCTGQPSKAAAAAKAVTLATVPPSATQCLSATELGQITNFNVSADLSIVKTAAPGTIFGGFPINYTLAVSNAGPSPANTVSVTDTLPAGTSFVSASGTGWTCNNVGGTVTCTAPSLPVGAAPSISLVVTAPAAGGVVSNTATVSSASNDPVPANNSSTVMVTTLPASAIPTLSGWMLALLALTLATAGFIVMNRRG